FQRRGGCIVRFSSNSPCTGLGSPSHPSWVDAPEASQPHTARRLSTSRSHPAKTTWSGSMRKEPCGRKRWSPFTARHQTQRFAIRRSIASSRCWTGSASEVHGSKRWLPTCWSRSSAVKNNAQLLAEVAQAQLLLAEQVCHGLES